MATPNVEFYQRQKDLQDQVSQSERERMQLEKQFKLLMQSDQNSSQLKATKLHTYWKKICADEKRAQQRNAMLMREFERIDSHLASMSARTQRLNFLKQQYADYIARTYPQWTRTVEQKMRGETQQPIQDQQNRQSGGNTAGVQRSQEWTEAEKEGSFSQPQQEDQYHRHHHHHHQQQQQQTQQQHQQQQQPKQSQQWMARLSRDESSAGDDSSGARAPMSQPVQNVSVQRVSSPVRVGNVSDITARKTPATPREAVSVRATGQPQQQQLPSSTKPSEVQHNARLESPKSEYVNISQFSNKSAAAPVHAGQGDHRSPMEGDDSDFGSDNDLPMSGGDASPVKRPSLREERVHSRQDSMRSLRSSGSLLPELTVDGLIRLLHHIEADLNSGKQGVEYYGSPILNPEEKIDLIQRANAGGALQGLSGTTASHLVLEQMSHVVRNLPEECLLGEQLLTQPWGSITADNIRSSLTGEAQKLWTAVFAHFNHLMEASVLEVKEIAAVFVPCLVADRSPYQDKAFALMVNLLEGDDATDASSIASPRRPASHLGNSNSLMEDGRVPPLKFGSLVDKPFSDEESSFFDQSVPKEPAVPLNETSAYKQMLSGTLSRSMQKAPVTSDDTDDDVEKEFANVLSPKSAPPKQQSSIVAPQHVSEPESPSDAEPKSPSPKSPVYVPTAVEQRSVFGSTGGSSQGQKRAGGLRLGSDFETDSEMEPAILGSSKKPDAEEDKDDFDFYD
ncbi:uncharacterized protein LOC143280800 [Babylonia areolata]|uniref:uncharacterized protein LOC143280800 n=1 Tax=Babylonia areolata TaxID=304850 RepID=UPI003FD6181C